MWNRIGEEQQINSWSHTMEKKTTTEEGSLRDRSCYVVGYAAAVLTSRSTPSSLYIMSIGASIRNIIEASK